MTSTTENKEDENSNAAAGRKLLPKFSNVVGVISGIRASIPCSFLKSTPYDDTTFVNFLGENCDFLLALCYISRVLHCKKHYGYFQYTQWLPANPTAINSICHLSFKYSANQSAAEKNIPTRWLI
jgi:hypothetical protein